MKWLPLESDPDLLNTYCSDINSGLNAQFVDVYGFDDELLEMVPEPVKALMFLFPVDIRSKEHTEFKGKCWFAKQTINNACGTVAVIHALANTGLAQGKVKQYIDETKNASALERGKKLESAKFIEEAHKQTAGLGTSEMDESTTLHFVTFIPVEGRIVEFDGRYEHPIDHGKYTDFLKDAAKVVEDIVKKSEATSFNLMALVADS